MDIVSLCLYLLSCFLRKNTSETDILIAGFDPSNIPPGSSLSSVIGSAIYVTRTLNVYKYLLSLINNTNYYRENRIINKHLVSFARIGNTSLVRYLVGKGADVSFYSRHGTVLTKPVRSYQDDIMDFLLE